jgi:NADPH:quinone reductase-like Zn-dependent oxidoreductase
MTMLEARYDTRGPVAHESIRAVPFEPPPLTTGKALVAVVAAAINPSDVLTLTGQYGVLPPLPAVGGSEGVGRVVELGPDTTGVRVGQLVLLRGGTWSTHVVVDAQRLIALPDGADPQQLAMLTVNPPTASLLLSEYVTLAAGDWVIQNVANSAVGGYLVQLAKLRGYRTVNIVRRESAVDGVKALGGDVVLVDGDDLPKRVKAAVAGAPIKLGIDAVGGKATERLGNCLAEGATLVNYGSMSGESCIVSTRATVFNDVALRGFWLVHWFKRSTREAQTALYGELTRLIATGKLHARVAATYPVEAIKDAIQAAASGERDGKILIVPS